MRLCDSTFARISRHKIRFIVSFIVSDDFIMIVQHFDPNLPVRAQVCQATGALQLVS